MFRLVGFETDESLKLAPVSRQTYKEWRSDDRTFALINDKDIVALQAELAPKVLQAEFMRNMHLLMTYDRKLIQKALFPDEGELSNHEKQYLFKIRGNYDARQFSEMQGTEGRDKKVTLTLNQIIAQIGGEGDRTGTERTLISDGRTVEGVGREV